jgi:hypothetical protein
MSIIVITDDPDNNNPGATRADFAGDGITNAGFEFASGLYTGLCLRAFQRIGI